MITKEESRLSNCKGVKLVGELQKRVYGGCTLEVDHERRKLES
jgi:hypothetical protein